MLMHRRHQFILIVGLLISSWLIMMLAHELGHVLGAICTGGEVQRVVWYPTVFSRTDVSPNPSPLVVVWAGPVVGAMLPALVAIVVARFRFGVAYFLQFFAGFCLLANGLYVGVGAFSPVGDAKDLLRLGSSRVVMILFGAASAIGGLIVWHRISPRLGLGETSHSIPPRHAYLATGLAVGLIAVGFVFGNRGV